ncbi:hypothetical protein [Pelagovum pacificum]|uniref:Uncharacterized protein n=1 Tax=Pelagovum pacificum TaxID=2588711 RepID=A0A5C5GFP1_9RHOB|nr:hypothetical protein [Pelagovum pacificum]QQA43351.1 hypothetical protein I8N54_01895 [Pelagovum pacificum]TNY33513.1 hypothetical protein FHY64_09630 [Pelagovum pacificum]
MRAKLLTAAVAILPGLPLLAQDMVLVDNLQACEGWDPDADSAMMDLIGEYNTILRADGTDTIEYGCTFEEPVEFVWHDEPQVRTGYCMEPGPFIHPTVFVLGLWPGEEDRAYLWQSDASGRGEPHVFYVCDGE